MATKSSLLVYVYDLLKNDTELQNLFGGSVNIHTRWGLPEINFPYIIMRLGTGISDVKGFWNGELIIDIFDQSKDVSKVLDISQRVIYLLDYEIFRLSDKEIADCWLDTNGEIEEPEDDIIHYNLVFSIRLFEGNRI